MNMIALKDIMDALEISPTSLFESTGIELGRVKELYEGKSKPSKLEMTAMLSVLKIDYEFYAEEKKDRLKLNVNERRVSDYIARRAEKKADDEVLADIAEKLTAAGFPITANEAAAIYSPRNKAFTSSIIERDDGRLLMAIHKAFPDAKATGEWINDEWKTRTNDPKPLFTDIFFACIAAYSKDPEVVYLVGKSDRLLKRFITGDFPWDDEKVLYLINEGSFCYSFISGFFVNYGGGGSFEPEKDVAKTLLIKEYCERQIAKKKGNN